jgi:hypothetical protein
VVFNNEINLTARAQWGQEYKGTCISLGEKWQGRFGEEKQVLLICLKSVLILPFNSRHLLTAWETVIFVGKVKPPLLLLLRLDQTFLIFKRNLTTYYFHSCTCVRDAIVLRPVSQERL